jgi:hypothetical protein
MRACRKYLGTGAGGGGGKGKGNANIDTVHTVHKKFATLRPKKCTMFLN